MRVTMLASTGDRCGIAAYSRELCAALREFVDLECEGISVGKQSNEHYRLLADSLNKADLVHIQHEHSFWGGILPGHSAYHSLRSLIKKPLVVTAHTTTSLSELLRLRQERRPIHKLIKTLLVMRRGYRTGVETTPFTDCAECIVHTEAGRKELLERGALPDRVHVITAGVPPTCELGNPDGAIQEFRKKHGLEGKRIVSLFGYIAPNKGYELTFDAIKELTPDTAFVIAGGPRTDAAVPYADSLRDRISNDGLTERAIITGWLNDEEVAAAMLASEVVVVPHTQATGSYSVMVPLSYGRPIVASNLPCFTEIWERVPCMRLFRSGDASHYAACLRSVLENAEGRREMSERALEYAAANTWRAVAGRTSEVYKTALGSNPE